MPCAREARNPFLAIRMKYRRMGGNEAETIRQPPRPDDSAAQEHEHSADAALPTECHPAWGTRVLGRA